MLDIAFIARVTVGVLLIIAGFVKYSNLRRFFVAIRSLQLMPLPAAAGVAVAIPSLELVAALLLLVGQPFTPWGAAGASLLFVVFATAMAVTIRRGVPDAQCGCFGGTGRPSWSLVVRNIGLAAWAFVAAAGPFTELLLAIVGAAAAATVMLGVLNRRVAGDGQVRAHS